MPDKNNQLKKNLFCRLGLHRYEHNYDNMYDEHTRTCEQCGKVQYAKVIYLNIKWQDEPIKRNTYTKQY